MTKIFSKLLLFICITIFISGCAEQIKTEQLFKKLQDPDCRAEMVKISDFVTYYYQNQRSDQLVSTLKSTLQIGFVGGSGEKPLGHFYATAIYNSADKNELLQQLIELQNQYNGRDRQIIQYIITETQNFYSPPASSDSNFDLLWAEFFATGKALPVKKIADYLQMTTCQKKIEVAYLASAEWSLAANAYQHKRVLAIIKQIYISSKGIQHKRLKRILANPKKVAADLDSNVKLGQSGDFESFKKIVW